MSTARRPAIDAVERRLSVGDRVRVRTGVGQTIVCSEMSHDPGEAGHAGQVAAEQHLLSAPRHRYLVRFDAPHPLVLIHGTAIALVGRHYASGELEPIDA